MSLFERRDVIVASVSCIYGLGDPEDYSELVVSLRLGQEKTQEILRKKSTLRSTTDIRRNDMNLDRGTFASTAIRLKSSGGLRQSIIRIEMFGVKSPPD